MTYQQSLENIKTLINFIRIYDKDSIFFDFSSESEFKIIFYDRETEFEKIRNLGAEKLANNLAAARIAIDENGHENFLYGDSNIDYECNLTTSEVINDETTDDYIQQCPAQIKLQVAQLLAKLKQM